MFERFTESAREVVVAARRSAGELGHRRVGTEHLLLGLLERPDSVPARLLGRHGLDHRTAAAAIARLVRVEVDELDGLDAEALESIGIDLDAVRGRIEESFGPGALDGRRSTNRVPFSPRSKKVLELSLREAIRLRHKHIGERHLLLGVLREGQGLGAKIIADRGVPFDRLRDELAAEQD